MDSGKVAKAAQALIKYLDSSKSDKNELFEKDDDSIYLVVKNKRYFGEYRSTKPKLVKLPHRVWGKDKRPSICIFTRDPQRTYKDALGSVVDRVVGVTKLKGKFKPYEARRSLKKSFELFLAEEDIVPMLPKLLGSTFFSTQASVPVPVILRKKDSIDVDKVSHAIDRILDSTVVVYPASTVMLVRIGSTGMKPKQLAENADAVVKYLSEKLPKGFESFKSLSIKTNQSPALPVYLAEKLYGEEDIGASEDEDFETESKKRAREEAELDELLKEVADEAEIKEYNRDAKRRRKQKKPETESEEKAETEAESKEDAAEKVETSEKKAEKAEKAEKVEKAEKKSEKKAEKKAASKPEKKKSKK